MHYGGLRAGLMPYADPAKNAECKKRYHDRKRAQRGLPPSEARPEPISAGERSRRRAEYRRRNRDAIAEYNRKWRAENRQRIEQYSKSDARRESYTADNRRRRSTVDGALHNRIGCGLRRSLGRAKHGLRWLDLVGYSRDDLRAHLERQFLRGMGWHNMGDWHIDHIIPLSSFTITGPDDPELRRAWALTNLRPLWAVDNLQKGARIETLL